MQLVTLYVQMKKLEFVNHYKNVQAANEKITKGFYVNSNQARNREIEDEGFLNKFNSLTPIAKQLNILSKFYQIWSCKIM